MRIAGSTRSLSQANNNVIDGLAYSNIDIRVAGNNNVLDGPAMSVGNVLLYGHNNETNGPVTENAPLVDWPFDIYNLDDYLPGGYYDLNDPNYHYTNSSFHFSGNNFHHFLKGFTLPKTASP